MSDKITWVTTSIVPLPPGYRAEIAWSDETVTVGLMALALQHDAEDPNRTRVMPLANSAPYDTGCELFTLAACTGPDQSGEPDVTILAPGQEPEDDPNEPGETVNAPWRRGWTPLDRPYPAN